MYFCILGTERFLNVRCRAVAEPNPHDLGRWSAQKTALAEVIVLGNDSEAFCYRMTPDPLVRG